MHARIDAAARSAGRDPAAIQRVYNVSGVIGGGDRASPLSGTPERWAESQATFAPEHGMDTFVFAEGNDAENQLRRFALEVVPRTRELVEQARRASAAR